MPPENKRYSPQEVRAVLSRTSRAGRDPAQSEKQQNGLTRPELLEVAQELGFSEADTVKALVQHEEDERIGRATGELRQLSYRRFSGHLIFFLFLNGILGLAGLWASRPLWLLVVMGMWVTWLMLHLRSVLFPDPEALRRRARQRLVDEELRQGGRELRQSVTAGAAKLLSLSAKTIDKGVEKLSPKD